jgi:protein-L-isoaspartate(D-aspartate) O-methyltransferase
MPPNGRSSSPSPLGGPHPSASSFAASAICGWEVSALSLQPRERSSSTAIAERVPVDGYRDAIIPGELSPPRPRKARVAGRGGGHDALDPRRPAHLLPNQRDLVRVIAASGVRDARLLDSLRRVPRAEFVPPELAHRAYVDEPLPIPHRQVTTQPSLIAKMVEALGLTGDEEVLEVGTGHGFQTALLAELASFVWSVERFGDLAETARANLERYGARNVAVAVGDGTLGLAGHGPYDAILVAAAFPRVPQPLVDQLRFRGRLVHPVGPGGQEQVALFEKESGRLVRRRAITGARFVRLVGEHGFAE